MKVLLIGGTGFLGRHTMQEFLVKGVEAKSAGRSLKNDYYVDLLLPKTLSNVLKSFNPDLIVNLAGAFSASKSQNLEVNSLGARNLVNVLSQKHFDGTPLIHISSATEPRLLTNQPLFESTYSESKFLGTKEVGLAIRMGKLSGALIRLHNCYGSDQPIDRFVAWAYLKLKAGEQINLKFPKRIRDFCFVKDAARCLVTLATEDKSVYSDEMREIGSGVGRSLHQVAFEIADFLKTSPNLIIDSEYTSEDNHPIEVAELLAGDSGKCATQLRDGLILSFGGGGA
jgi:nucleoside-diphosphate-sugar epimerase